MRSEILLFTIIRIVVAFGGQAISSRPAQAGRLAVPAVPVAAVAATRLAILSPGCSFAPL